MDLRTRNELLAFLPRLRRFARGLAGNAAEADDLVQVACERAIRHIDQWTPGTRLDSWVLRIARTAWVDNRRAQRIRQDYATAAQLDGVSGQAGHAEPRAIAHLTVGAVDAAMRRLPEDQRMVLMLVCVEQLTYARAAEVLGVPVGTVMSRLARARLALRRLVDGDDQASEEDQTSGRDQIGQPARRQERSA